MNCQKIFFFLSLNFLGICLVLQIYTIFLFFFASINTISFIKSSIGYTSIIILNIVFIFFNRKKHTLTTYLSNKEAIFIASFIWLMMIIMGIIPYLQFGYSIIDALFESSSGFSTTGATIITNIENQPKILLFWRSLTQWLGGMGVIMLLVSLMPVQNSSKSLFQFEITGPYKEGIVSQIRNSSRILWFIYTGLTTLCCLTYRFLGMTWYEAINHSLTTISTSGFSTSNSSFTNFSIPLQWSAIFFMLLGGSNFIIYYLIIKKHYKKIFKNEELKVYLKLVLVFSLFLSLSLILRKNNYSIEECFRYGFFSVTSLLTTTGYSNFDYGSLPQFLQAMIFLILLIGGCSGSTSGGIKIYRVILFFKSIIYELKCMLTNSIITSVKINNNTLENEVLKKTLTLIGIYFLFFVLGGLLLFASGIDFLTAFSASISCIHNIGPGLGEVGPTNTFAHLNSFAKIICSILMLLGRLEFYTLLALFYPYLTRAR